MADVLVLQNLNCLVQLLHSFDELLLAGVGFLGHIWREVPNFFANKADG
jgi:hypothetical protein